MTGVQPLAVTMGDPSGCGPQITARLWAERHRHTVHPFFVVGLTSAYQGLCPVVEVSEPAETAAVYDLGLPIIPLESASLQSFIPGQPNPNNASAIIESIAQATRLTLQGSASGVVTNPISKAVLYDAGFKHPGHTEFIAALCEEHVPGSKITPIMMLSGGGLKVALVTIHIPLMSVAAAITSDRLMTVATTVNAALKTDYGIANPRIAFTGLNPHAGENGSIGLEEKTIINPTATALRENGVDITDARSADTVFHDALSGQFDAVIAMTHDQGLIPVKTLDMWGGVNTTLGLPIVRTSPDHGTAYEAAAAGECRADSLIAAIKHAEMVCTYRSQND